MGSLANFKLPNVNIPKIDKSILPTASDFGVGNINDSLSSLKDKINTDGISLDNLPNPKGEALDMLKSIPKIGNFSIMSLVPTSMLDKMDTEKMTKDINAELASLDTGDIKLQLPNDIGTMAKDAISGKGIDFSSLYSMPTIANSFNTSYNIGSDFNMDEMMAEVNAMSDAASGEFDINKYVKEFSDLDI